MCSISIGGNFVVGYNYYRSYLIMKISAISNTSKNSYLFIFSK